VKALPLQFYTPIGTTDSEHAFCWLMDGLRARFAKRPSEAVLDRAIAEAFAHLRALGVFNALLGDGRSLYTSCSKRLCFIRRAAPFGRARLIDEDLEVDFAKETSPGDKVVIVATRPLTRDEVWSDVQPGTTLIFRDGDLARSFMPRSAAA